MARARKSDAEKTTEPAKRHPLERYEVEEIARSLIKNAPYNPRVISDKERDALQDGLRHLGLLQPLIWNKRSGNLVGGHQRLKILDRLSEVKEYLLRVAVVDLGDDEEVEANLLLNNPQAMGDWDIGKLEEALRRPNIRIEATGFDAADVYRILGDIPGTSQHAHHVEDLADRLRATEAIGAGIADAHDRLDDPDFYIVCVFRNPTHRQEFLDKLELKDERFHDGRKLLAKLDERRPV